MEVSTNPEEGPRRRKRRRLKEEGRNKGNRSEENEDVTEMKEEASETPVHHHHHLHEHYDRSVHIRGDVGNVSTGDGHTGDMVVAFSFKQRQRQEEKAKELEEWTKGMVETSALMKVMKMLNSGITWITIKGSPGEGKTTVGKMALRELQKSGRQVFQVRSPEEFSEIKKTCSRPVIMLDDILGDLEFDHTAWLRWKDVFHEVLDVKEHRCHEQEVQTPAMKDVTILLVGRDYIFKASSFHMGRLYNIIIHESRVVDMSHSAERQVDEKQRIWDAVVGPSGIQVPQNTVQYIFGLKGGHGFPHVCRLFVTIRKQAPDMSPINFFQTPLVFLNETIQLFLENDSKLHLFKEMIKRQGKVSERDLQEGNFRVMKTAKELVGTYLRKEDGYFVFDHPSIYDSVSFSLCNYHTLFVIENCQLAFIHQRLRLECPHGSDSHRENNQVTYISQCFVEDLAKRFADELSKRNLYLVLSHPACTQETFIREMMSQLTLSLSEVIKLADGFSARNNERFLTLVASNKSPHLLKYIDNHTETPLSQNEINTVLYGVCKYAARDVLSYLTESTHTLDINVRFENEQTPLMIAAKTRDSEFVHQIMSLKPDLDARDRFYKTPLHYMCECGHVSAVRQAIASGADINVKGRHGESHLYWACIHQQREVVRLLLDSGARVGDLEVLVACASGTMDVLEFLSNREKTVNIESPLKFPNLLDTASFFGQKEVINHLMDKGASVNTTRAHQTTLHMPCITNKPEVVRCLLEHGADIDRRDSSGNTALHKAAEFGSTECVDVLLKAGANMKIRCRDGYTPLHKAAEMKFQECVDVLLKAGADVNTQSKYGYTPLHMAAGQGSEECVDSLLKAGADVSVRSADGETPLHDAAKSACKECVEALLTNGADVNVKNEDGDTPLHDAAVCGGTECITLLLKAGADINVQCSYGYSPLHRASRWGYTETVSVLLKAGADVDIQSEDGDTPLHHASADGSKECVVLLLKAGADVNVQNTAGNTPLHVAAEHGFGKCMDVILKAKPDINVRNGDNYTPLHKASSKRSNPCVDMLVKAGAEVNAQTKSGRSPLHTAVHHRECDHLHVPDVSVCQKLIKHGASVNQQDTEGNTPLHLLSDVDEETVIYKNWSSEPGSYYEDVYRTLVALLVESGADVNLCNHTGEPALRGWCQTLGSTTELIGGH